MRALPTFLALIASALVATSAFGRPDATVWLKKGDQSLNAAFAQAKATLPIFWRHVEHDPQIEDAAVKVPFPDAHGGVEFLWVRVTGHTPVSFRGVIGNEPDDVPNVHEGQSYAGRNSSIVDWAYYKGPVGYGQFTTRVLAKTSREFQQQSAGLAPTPLEPGDR